MIGSAKDVTDIYQRQKESLKVRHAYEEFHHHSIKNMMRAIAHHWRQPLNTIMMLFNDISDQIVNSGRLTEELNGQFNLVYGTLHDLSDNITFFARTLKTDAAQYFNPKATLNSFCCLMQNDLMLDSITLNNRNDLTEEVWVKGNESELIQVLMQLVNNSKEAILKQREEGKLHKNIKAYITILSVLIGDELHITIIDNGGGMDESMLIDATSPYSTSKFSKNFNGMGLYFCKITLEEKFNAKMFLENYENGLKVKIHLPMAGKANENV